MIDGKRRRVTFKARGLDEAVQKVLELQKRPELVAGSGWEREVRKYLEDAREKGRLSEKYAAARGPVLLKIGRQIGIPSGADLTPARVVAWYEEELRDPEKKVGTVNHYLLHLRGFCKWLEGARIIDEDPTKKVEMRPDQGAGRQRFLPPEEVARVLAIAREEDPELELILLLGFEVGMRRGEISAARAEWIDLERGLVTIPAVDRSPGAEFKRKGKEGRRREVTVPMVKALKDWFAAHGVPAPYLVKPEKQWAGGRYRYEFRERLEAFWERAGVRDFTAHDMRRSFGSNRVSAGVSLEKVANWMGIHPATAWKHYARFIPADASIEQGSAGGVGERERDPAPAEAAGRDRGRSIAERLAELQGLEVAGLISVEDAAAKRREILSEL